MVSKDADPTCFWIKVTKTKLRWIPDKSVRNTLSEIWSNQKSPFSTKLANHKRKWDDTKEEINHITNAIPWHNQKNIRRNIKKSKQEVMVPYGFSSSHPPTDRGEVRTMSSKWHNCPINALLVTLFGDSIADEIQPFEETE